MIEPNLQTFRQRATEGNLVPVWREVLADLETPVSVFRKLKDSPHAFLLESVEGGEQIGRYSFLGADPFLIFRARGEEQELLFTRNETPVEQQATPMETLREILRTYRGVPHPSLPPLAGGAVGFMSYDMV